MQRDDKRDEDGRVDRIAGPNVHDAILRPGDRIAEESAGAEVWERVCGADERDVQEALSSIGGRNSGCTRVFVSSILERLIENETVMMNSEPCT